MNKLTFIERNDAVVRLKAEQHFDADKALLEKLCPNSKLLPELKRVSQFNRATLCSKVLLELLTVATEAEILANRGEKKNTGPAPGSTGSTEYTEDDVRVALGEMYSEANSGVVHKAYNDYKTNCANTKAIPKTFAVWYEKKFASSNAFRKLTPVTPDPAATTGPETGNEDDKKKDEANLTSSLE